jgi:hypothetical protein
VEPEQGSNIYGAVRRLKEFDAMNSRMNRVNAVSGLALLALASGLAAAQQPAPPPQTDPQQQNAYQGQSNPPADDTIQTAPAQDQSQPLQKPSPSVPMQQPAPAPNPAPQTAPPMQPPANVPQQDGDSGTVQVAPPQPALTPRSQGYDPDGDIVHPEPLPPGTLEEGTRIRVRLQTELSSARSEKGDAFRGRVDSDVMQDGQVLIPAGAEIEGKVVEASSGHFGGRGSLRLRPEMVILPNGSQYMLVARVADTRDSHTRVNSEGTIQAGPRYKRDGIEYAGGVGVGVVTGAVLGGPAGALAGGLIGAGAVTVHLLMNHPQANLEPGSVLLFTLSNRLTLVAPNATGN